MQGSTKTSTHLATRQESFMQAPRPHARSTTHAKHMQGAEGGKQQPQRSHQLHVQQLDQQQLELLQPT